MLAEIIFLANFQEVFEIKKENWKIIRFSSEIKEFWSSQINLVIQIF